MQVWGISLLQPFFFFLYIDWKVSIKLSHWRTYISIILRDQWKAMRVGFSNYGLVCAPDTYWNMTRFVRFVILSIYSIIWTSYFSRILKRSKWKAMRVGFRNYGLVYAPDIYWNKNQLCQVCSAFNPLNNLNQVMIKQECGGGSQVWCLVRGTYYLGMLVFCIENLV